MLYVQAHVELCLAPPNYCPCYIRTSTCPWKDQQRISDTLAITRNCSMTKGAASADMANTSLDIGRLWTVLNK